MDTHGETARNRKPQHQTTAKMTDHRTKTPSTPNQPSCTEANLTQNTHRNQLETVKTKLPMTTKNQKLKTKQAGVRPPSSPPSPTQTSSPTQPSTKPHSKPSQTPPIPRPLNPNPQNSPSPSQPPTHSPNPDPPTTPALVTPIPKATDQSPRPSRETFSEVLRKRKKKTPSPPVKDFLPN